MSQINVNTIRNRTGGPPSLDKGAVVTGIVTATSGQFAGDVTVGGTLTYEDVTNIDSTGIVTAKSGIKVGNPVSPGIGATIDPNGNAVFVGIVSATNFEGKLSKGNTEVDVIDTGSNGHVKMTTEGSERIRIGPAGQIGLGGANYGDVGQVLTSGGAAAPAWSTIDAAPSVKLNASGSIAAGKPTIVNTDGTVSEAKQSVAGKTDITFTAQTQYYVNSYYPASVYVPGTDSIVLVEQDKDTGDAGQVGAYTIVGSSLTKGSVSFFNNKASNLSMVWDSGNSRYLTFFCDFGNSNELKCAIGSVSGNTASHISTVNVAPGGTNAVTTNGPRLHGSVYDPDSQKTIVVWPDGSGNAYACVVSVDGSNNITFGASSTIATGDVQGVDCTYDTVNNKVLVQVRKGSSGDVYMTSYVGTVSGTSISFGSADTISTSQTTGAMGIVYMTEQQKAFCIYNDSGNDGGRLYSKIGTVSGNSITWGTGVKCGTNNNTLVIANAYASLTYDTYSKLPAMTWRATASGDSVAVVAVKSISGTTPTFSNIVEVSGGGGAEVPFVDTTHRKEGVVVWYRQSTAGRYNFVKISDTTTNVTGENYLGLSAASYTNGQEATVKITGNNDNNQVGLTTGQTYYVQNDGTLGTTIASPTVIAGTAISQTKLIINATPVAPPAWELISTHVLSGATTTIDSTGWSNEYAEYKVVYDHIYRSSSFKVWFRVYTDSTSGNTGTLQTASNYGYGAGYFRCDTTTNQMQGSGWSSQASHILGQNTSLVDYSGHQIFPMKTGDHNARPIWYGQTRANYEHVYVNDSGFYGVQNAEHVTGMRMDFYNTSNNALISPTNGRITILRLKV